VSTLKVSVNGLVVSKKNKPKTVIIQTNEKKVEVKK
jgi:hypothetical protein